MLHEEVKRFAELSGEDPHDTSISRIGGFLDGYEKGKEDGINECNKKMSNVDPRNGERTTNKMTNEEAIIKIRDHMEIHKMHEPQSIFIKKALDMAISALDKQVPKKPDSISNMGTTYWNCPYCRSLVADSVTGVRYMHNCGVCGQKLDW